MQDEDRIVQAILDLTRVMIATQGGFENQSEAIRKLHALSIPANRIAAILAASPNTVSGVIAKAKKKEAKGKTSGEG